MHKIKSLLFFALLLPALVKSQTITGRVMNSDGLPVSFASIYVPELHKGTTANSEGHFQLDLPEGEHEVIVRYLGYAPFRKKVQLASGLQYRLDVMLQPQAMSLPEVIITASGQDPAVFIMRKAIALGPYYRNQIEEYRARVYVKGTGLPERIPPLLRQQLKSEGIREGKYIVTETLSEIHYRRGQPLNTRIISTRSAGLGNEDVPMQFATLSLYNDINGVISPLSRDAFAVYRFRLEGSYLEEGQTIYRIRVIPKRKGKDVYSGIIMIREGSWNLQAVDLNVSSTLYDLNIRQVYQQVEPMVWMAVSHDYRLRLDALGGRATFGYVASLSDISVKLNQQIDHKRYAAMMDLDFESVPPEPAAQSSATFADVTSEKTNTRIEQLAAKEDLTQKEMRELNRLIALDATTRKPATLEIRPRNTEFDDSARLRTSEHWSKYRPIPLTAGEAESFGEKTDSTDVSNTSKYKWLSDIIFGRNDYRINPKTKFTHNGLVDYSSIGYNTIDGFRWSQRMGLIFDFPNARQVKTFAEGNWAFSRSAIDWDLDAEWLSGPLSRTRWFFSAARKSTDFDANTGMRPFVNTYASLFLGRNHMKLYLKESLYLGLNTDISNGFTLSAAMEWAVRSPLDNQSDFAFFMPKGRQFSPNIPESFVQRTDLFVAHKAAILAVSLKYTPEYYYRVRDGRKQMAYSRFPTFGLAYRGGLPKLAGSQTRFSHWEFSLKHSYTRRLIGTIDYGFAAGGFSDTTRMGFQDYRHFRADPLPIGEQWQGVGFRAAVPYSLATNQSYVVLHGRLGADKLLIKRFPALALRNFGEQIRLVVLLRQQKSPVLEFGYGVQQLFFFADAEVFIAAGRGLYQHAGFNVSLPLRRILP